MIPINEAQHQLQQSIDSVSQSHQPIAVVGQTSNAVLLSESDMVEDMRWDRAFTGSPDALTKLAAIAMAEYHAGKTQEVDPEIL